MKTRQRRRHREKSSSATTTPGADPAATRPAVIPLKPRPRLFLALTLIFALWFAALLWMYFATVFPPRKPATPADVPATTQPLDLQLDDPDS